jgi:hypothetical protein
VHVGLPEARLGMGGGIASGGTARDNDSGR